jgi:hypothetical protein
MSIRRSSLGVAVVLAACLPGCGSGAHPAAHPVTTRAAVPAPPTSPPSAPPPPTRRRRPHRRVDPGRLPQTRQLPSASTPVFRAEMRSLFAAISSGAPGRALVAFFPETAYAQVKAIPDPDADYTGRLLEEYRLDITAAHAGLGARARAARLVAVHVPAPYAHWVDPGVCFNHIGYWEVPNARVIYRNGATLASFGIASLISWRGRWYVVHLGAVTRSGGGIVDAPSAGQGVSAPSSTC